MSSQPLILLADDEAATRFIMKEALEQAGFSVLEAENGLDAMAAFDRHRPDLVLLDVIMPQMDGFEACRRLRTQPGGEALPIVIITGSDDFEAISSAYEAGATDFIAKPINWMILCERVRYMLRASTNARKLHQSQELLARAQKIAQLGSFYSTPESPVIEVSDAFRSLCGLGDPDAQVSWNDFWATIHPDDRQTLAPMLQKACVRGISFRQDIRLVNGSAADRYIMLQMDAETGSEGQVTRLVGIVQDISERKLSELLERDQKNVMQRIARKEALKAIFLEAARLLERQRPRSFACICQVEGEQIEMMVSPSLPARLCQSMADTPLSAENGTCPAAAYLGQSVVAENLSASPFWEGRREPAKAHGFRSSASVPVFSGTGQILGTVGMLQKERYLPTQADLELMDRVASMVTLAMEQHHLSQRLIHQAQHDPLTGLVNRSTLAYWLSRLLKQYRRSKAIGAYLLIDLDRFKQINDALGHHIGDRLLKALAGRLKQDIRDSDVLSRIGGDEFVLVLPDIKEKQDAVRAAVRILDALKAPFFIEEYTLQVEASIGVTIFPEDAGDETALHKNADIAMYTAKNQGGRQYFFFDSQMHEAVVQRLQIENDLRKAIERGEFELHYQPQIALASGRLLTLEALIRWNHPEKGRIPPDQFIPVAERSQLIIPIGQWVLREACRQHIQWRAQGFAPVRIAVNVSAVQFRDTDFVETVREVLTETGLEPSWLEVEITETVVLNDLESACDSLTQLKEMGVTTTLDDFGTGYSSIAYLRQMPLDSLKIDKSFIRDMQIPGSPDDSRNTSLVKAFAALAQNLGLKLVAEGIETEDQYKFLMAIGYGIGQGFLFSAPVPADKAARLLA